MNREDMKAGGEVVFCFGAECGFSCDLDCGGLGWCGRYMERRLGWTLTRIRCRQDHRIHNSFFSDIFFIHLL